MDWLARQLMLIGADATDRLRRTHVAVFGLGGVGGHAAEALARCGLGELTLVDGDVVSLTNLNRQLIATYDSMGLYKADVMAARLLSINPVLRAHPMRLRFMPGSESDFGFDKYDYIIDAIDTVTAKVHLALLASRLGVPIVSAMGAGDKLDPTRFEVADISETSVCPLCRGMRKELKRAGVNSLKVVYSKEKPCGEHRGEETQTGTRNPPGSIAFVPPVMGMILAGEVVRALMGLIDLERGR